MLLIMMMLIERNGQVDQLDFAKRIHNWMTSGFKELGDIGTYLEWLSSCQTVFIVCFIICCQAEWELDQLSSRR